MGSAKLIRDALITILTDGDPKNSAGKGLTTILKGEPPKHRYPSFPFGWIQWTGGPITPSSMAAKNKVTDNFFIVVVDKYPDEKKVEDSMLSFYDSIEALLDNDLTITGTVASSWVTNREVDRFFMGDYSMAGLRITLQCRKRE